jgi:signal transduction histidine kinase
VAASARQLVGAAAAWVAIRARDVIEVAAADGTAAEALLGSTLPAANSLAAQAMEGGQRVSVDDMAAEPAVLPAARAVGLGPGIYLPMLAEGEPVGSLVLARLAGSPPFSDREVAAAEIFASAAAIVVALDTGRHAVEETRMTSEHERIASDLHDTVIQRLFALGMKLQATERLSDRVVAQRIGDVVESIDEVIREIRETVFDLNHPDAESSRLRQLVRGVASEATEHLGFSPRIAFRGPVEAAITDEMGRHLGSVLREALANVGRHARATSVDVVIIAAEDFITLSVADDGIGMSDSPTAGNGTSNMARRAEALGGDLTIGRRNPTGTLLQWRVPAGF